MIVAATPGCVPCTVERADRALLRQAQEGQQIGAPYRTLFYLTLCRDCSTKSLC
jgi:hypothetical protein